MSGRGLPEYVNAYLREQMRAWLAAEPGRKQTHLAKELEFTDAQVSAVLNEQLDDITLHSGHAPAAIHLRATTEVVEGGWIRRGLPLIDVRIKKDALATGVRVILPRYGFRKVVSALGRHDLAALAAPFMASQTMVAIRMAEIYGYPLALVSAARTWRAVLGWQLPSNTALALIVRRGGTKAWAVREIDDKPGRWWAVWPRDW